MIFIWHKSVSFLRAFHQKWLKKWRRLESFMARPWLGTVAMFFTCTHLTVHGSRNNKMVTNPTALALRGHTGPLKIQRATSSKPNSWKQSVEGDKGRYSRYIRLSPQTLLSLTLNPVCLGWRLHIKVWSIIWDYSLGFYFKDYYI